MIFWKDRKKKAFRSLCNWIVYSYLFNQIIIHGFTNSNIFTISTLIRKNIGEVKIRQGNAFYIKLKYENKYWKNSHNKKH